MSKLAPPISVAKVAAFLGVVSGDVGTLCTSNKINKASLHKPTWVGLDPTKLCNKDLDLLDKKPTGKYEAVGFGLFVPYCTNMSDILTTASKPWVHAAPTTATDNYKCLAHFDGYDHNASLTSVCGSLNVVEDAEITFHPTATSNATSVGLENIPFFTSTANPYYYGCEFYVGTTQSNMTCKKRVVATTPIRGAGADSADSPITEAVLRSGTTAKQGNWVKIVVFVTNTEGKTAIDNGGLQDVAGSLYYSCMFAEGVVTSGTTNLPTYTPFGNVYKQSNNIYVLEFTNPHPSKSIKSFTVIAKDASQPDRNPGTYTGRVGTITFPEIANGGFKSIEFTPNPLVDRVVFLTTNVYYKNSTSAIQVPWPDVDDTALPAT